MNLVNSSHILCVISFMCTPVPLKFYLTRSHHFSAVGVDLHQKLVLIKEINLNFVMKYRTKQLSSFQENDGCIIEDTENTVQASCQVSHRLTEVDRISDM